MDTSKEYIKKCEKAPKLQPRDLEFLNGDYIYYKNNWGIYFKEKFYQEGVYNDGSLINYDDNPFRLHMQDQLQEMIEGLPVNHVLRIYRFIDRQDDGSGRILKYNSMEELWLAFIMKEKYNKIWNGDDWTK